MRRARVMLRARVRAGAEQDFERAFDEVTQRMQHAEGFIQDELLRVPEAEEPTYIVLSEWVSREAFLTWFEDPRHHDTTAPMNPYWYGHQLDITELVSRMDRYAPRDPAPETTG